MKKIFIIFLFIIFSSSFSLAENNGKITVKEVEDLLNPEEIYKIDLFLLNSRKPYNDYLYLDVLAEQTGVLYFKIRFQESYKKRVQTRGIAKCMYGKDLKDNNLKNKMPGINKKCELQVIRTVFRYSEKYKKKKTR